MPLLPGRGPNQPLNRPRALREIPLLKGLLIAGVWTAVTVGLPALLHAPPPAVALAKLAAQRFCLVAALALVFDLRDLSRDRAAGLRTVPVLLGTAGAKVLALWLLVAALAFGLWRGTAPGMLALVVAPAAAVVLAARETRSEYFFALLADGVLLVPAALYLALR